MRPPQHRADATPVFIFSMDEAWDYDRINAEQADLRKAAQSGDDDAIKALRMHPYGRYIRGETRGDLTTPDANGVVVTDYLDGTETRIELRRLSILDVARFRDQSERVGRLAAARAAYDGSLEALLDAHGAELVFELGEFALRCSEAPRPGESSRSVS
jgi:hypothetical protein